MKKLFQSLKLIFFGAALLVPPLALAGACHSKERSLSPDKRSKLFNNLIPKALKGTLHPKDLSQLSYLEIKLVYATPLQDNEGRTLLHAAAHGGNLELVRFLTQKQNINLKWKAATPLSQVSSDTKPYSECNAVFKAPAMDPSATDRHGKSAIDHAQQNGNKNLVRYLLAK